MTDTTNTPQGQELQQKGADAPVLEITEDYTKMPNSVLFSQSLSGNAKVAFGVLYHTHTWALSQGKLNEDGSFYCATSRLAERMDIGEKTVGETVIPTLINSGLITKCEERQDVNGKETNRYIINFSNIRVYEGEPDAVKEARKSQRGRHAYEGKVAKERQIRNKYGDKILELAATTNRFNLEIKASPLIRTIQSEYRYTNAYATQLVCRLVRNMVKDYPDVIREYLEDVQSQKDESADAVYKEHWDRHHSDDGWDDDEDVNYNDEREDGEGVNDDWYNLPF